MRKKIEVNYKRLRINENIRPLGLKSLAKLAFPKDNLNNTIYLLSRWDNGFCLTSITEEKINKIAKILKVDSEKLVEYK